MKKVAILSSDYHLRLEDKINEFLESHNVTDIQYQMSCCSLPWNSCSSETHSAMIVYEE